ncbi:MarR family transcriptional regulator [Geomonas sp. RF6]|uniref:MarR family winged helix-turn-helix transcriptional regulator n=1 Tax=Geomonas sp. RF6 TaxID=2897342 RepID=UPI001E3F0E38|nr:MarR family transcriptional regulator [Geomonas sp. RF6]UFS69698.1 MarR family transcriptional regulator [Geomonas sp. RF6]
MNTKRTEILDIERSVGFLLAKAYQRGCAVFKEEFDRHEVTPQQFAVLAFLWQEDRLTQAELSARSQIDRTTVGGLVDRLEKEGLLSRQSHPEDRRAHLICLTERGRSLEEELCAQAAIVQERWLKKLPPDEVETLKYLLEKIRS